MANPKEACILLQLENKYIVNTEIILKWDGTAQNRSYDLKFYKFS